MSFEKLLRIPLDRVGVLIGKKGETKARIEESCQVTLLVDGRNSWIDNIRVIGFDRLEPGHNRSSSFGESRVIRLAYFEHPSYVPLLRGAYRAWRDLEVATGERVLTITGSVEAGHPGAALVEGSVRSAREHDLPHELLSPRQVNDRFPAFNLPADWECVAQPDGGVLLPEKAIGLFVAAAQDLGASVG